MKWLRRKWWDLQCSVACTHLGEHDYARRHLDDLFGVDMSAEPPPWAGKIRPKRMG